MPRNIVILGGGTGGTLTANRLRKHYKLTEAVVSVVDKNREHIYQPGLLFVPFGLANVEDLIRPRERQLKKGIDFYESEVDRVDIEGRKVFLEDGRALAYDALIIATGARILPEETEGLTDDGWMDKMFTFYDAPGAMALAKAYDKFEGGRIVVNIIDMPIKCPVAPLEFCFLSDWYFREKGIRDKVEITYVTPLDSAFTKPRAAHALAGLMDKKGIKRVTQFNTGEVDGPGGRLIGFDEREVPFDLAVVIPAHAGAGYIGRSEGLGDALDFVQTDKHTLQSKASPSIFAIGDGANLPASKAGSVSHFEGEVLVENVIRYIAGQDLDASFDGHANCFIETGFQKALLIDFNYEQEPVEGHFPTKVGMPLLKEARLNHLGKLMFQWFYWHVLLPGRDVPGIEPDMPKSGKHLN